ncbi:MAG: proton-conducting transporter membrane subunit [Persicimonas sp.]
MNNPFILEWTAWLPLLVVLSSLVPGIFIFLLHERQSRLRISLNVVGALMKLAFIAVMLWGVYHGFDYETRLPLFPGFDFILDSSPLAMLFVTLSAVLWVVTTVYAVGYLEATAHRTRFFGFFAICVSTTTGIALAGNLLTFIIFYEILTVTTYPLVVHRETEEARRAGRTYLAYTLAGGAVFFFGVVWIHTHVGPFDFVSAGALPQMGVEPSGTLVLIFWVLVIGLGVKTAIVPLHGWLPTAMVAPAPVSALLHAVAVVKAGAFGIVRVVYDVFGLELVTEMNLNEPLAVAASITIIYGSLCALYQDDLKRMLAYSTVSQLSYIVLGVATAGPIATIGGVVHLVHQGLMKITLFFCAGCFDQTLHLKKISNLAGVGRRMPLTMVAFTIAALGMIGVPPLAGFISKWFLGVGAVEAGTHWVLWVLVASTILNAAYFLPVLYTAWFDRREKPWEEHRPHDRFEALPSLLFPTLITAALVVLAGIFAETSISPLAWVRIVAESIY